MMNTRERNRLAALGDQFREMAAEKAQAEAWLRDLRTKMTPMREKMLPLIVKAIEANELTFAEIAELAGYGNEESIRRIAREAGIPPRRSGRKVPESTEPKGNAA